MLFSVVKNGARGSMVSEGFFFTLGSGLENGVAGADTALKREPRWDRRGPRGGQEGALRGQEVPKVLLGGPRERAM